MADGKNVAVTYEEMTDLASKLKATMNNIQGEISKAQSYISQVAGASWQGQAATTYSQLQSQWQSSVKQLLASGNGMADFLGKAAGAYHDVDSQLSSGLSKG